MGFWIRKLIFGVVLAITAYVLLDNQELLVAIADNFSSEESNTTAELDTTTITSEETPTVEEPKPVVKKAKSQNSAAEGLSRFYASINPGFNDKGPRIHDNIVYLSKPEGDLSSILEARKKVTRPLRKSWQGNRESRPFRIGETLYQKLSEYAQEQGVEVMWWLDRDFLIKDPFRIDKDMIKTAFQIGKAIEGHFENGVDIYFCYQHRALVLIDQPDNYLATECTLLSTNKAAW